MRVMICLGQGGLRSLSASSFSFGSIHSPHWIHSCGTSYYNLSSVCLCVCLFVCLFVPYVLRGPLTDLRQTWWVYVGWPPICPWGVLFRKGQRLHGSTGHFRFPLYYICASLTPHAATAPFAWQAAESNSAPFAVLHVNDVCRWTWQLLLRGSFSKRSTGQRVDGSTGHFHFHYIIYDSRRRQAHVTLLQKAHGVNGLTGQWVDGSNGSTGHFHFHYIIYDSRRRQAHATPLQKVHGVWWHQAHATPLQKAHSVFCSLDG